MALDLTKIEDVMKAISVEKIEVTHTFIPNEGKGDDGEGDQQEGEGQGEGQGEPGDGEGQQGEGEDDSEGEDEDEGEDEGESEDESEGEPEPIEIQVDPGAPVYVVRIWTDEHIANDYPDLRYEVEAEYPADAATAAHAAAAEALGTPDFFGTAVYDPALQEERARKAAEEAKKAKPRSDDDLIYQDGTTITMKGLDEILKHTYKDDLKDRLMGTTNVQDILKDLS